MTGTMQQMQDAHVAAIAALQVGVLVEHAAGCLWRQHGCCTVVGCSKVEVRCRHAVMVPVALSFDLAVKPLACAAVLPLGARGAARGADPAAHQRC
jgi:hypothetical protein